MKKYTFIVATLNVYTYICVVMKIEEEIQQTTFKNIYQKANINLLFSAAWLTSNTTQALKPFNISWQQFNVLRILRGMHPKPASVKLLMERMIDKMSNASRLVEKLKQKGLVERVACPADRRQVDIFITDKGLQLLEEASAAVETLTDGRLGSLTEEEAMQLNQLLDKFRG